MSAGRDLLLGLDVGTTATKAVLYDLDGRQVAAATQPTALLTPQTGWVEQDPEDLWRSVTTTIRAVLAQKAARDRVVALSQSSQGGTTIPVDAGGKPVANAISWMDERSGTLAEADQLQLDPAWVRATTGWAFGRTLSLQHINWLRKVKPDVFAAARRFVFVNDFIGHHLTGNYRMNPSDATMTQLFDISRGDWSELLLAAAGIDRSAVSPLALSGAPTGMLTAQAASETGLPAQCLVVNGAHDQYCAAVGARVVRPGPVLLSCGTAWVILVVPETLEAGLSSGMSISCHAVPGRWGAIRSLGGVGAAPEWLINHSYRGEAAGGAARYALLNAEAAAAQAGAKGLCFFPLVGGHAPSLSGRGGFVGLTLSHTRADLARAVMEGVAYELRWVMQELRDRGLTVAGSDAGIGLRFHMVGGAADSAVWPQIIADVTGIPVALPGGRHIAARGAAVLAGAGAGLLGLDTGFQEDHAAQTHILPDPALRACYDVGFARYQRLFNSLNADTGCV